MPSTISALLLIPTLILASLPLLPLALLTTTFALAALALRATLVYIELATALLKKLVVPESPAALSVADYSLKSNLQSRPLYSFSSSGSVTPRRPSAAYSVGGQHPYSYAYPSTQSFHATGTGSSSNVAGLERDFEGMGGWREAGEGQDEDERQWTGINSRLELPAAGMRTRTGSFTSSHSHMMNSAAAPDGRAPSSGSASGSVGSGSNHKRSWTSGAVRFGLGRSSSSRGKWWSSSKDGGDFGTGRAERPNSSGRRSGTMSPDDNGLMMMPGGRTRSLADMGVGMNVGRSRAGSERRKSGSSGSLSSVEMIPVMTGSRAA